MNQEQIGKFISELRKEKNMTQGELAELMGVTDKSISRWENGKTMPDISLLIPLADIFKVSIQELLNGKKMNREELLELKDTVDSLVLYESNQQIKNGIKTNKFIIIGNIILVIALLSEAFELFEILFPINTVEFIHGFLFSFGLTLNICGVYNNSHNISVCERKKELIRKLKIKK